MKIIDNVFLLSDLKKQKEERLMEDLYSLQKEELRNIHLSLNKSHQSLKEFGNNHGKHVFRKSWPLLSSSEKLILIEDIEIIRKRIDVLEKMIVPPTWRGRIKKPL